MVFHNFLLTRTTDSTQIFTGFYFMLDHTQHEHCLHLFCQLYKSCDTFKKNLLHLFHFMNKKCLSNSGDHCYFLFCSIMQQMLKVCTDEPGVIKVSVYFQIWHFGRERNAVYRCENKPVEHRHVCLRAIKKEKQEQACFTICVLVYR